VYILFALLAALMGTRLVAADQTGSKTEEFHLGARLGQCLQAKCQAFRGTLTADSPQSGRPITVHVDEWLFGKPSTAPETIDIPYQDQQHVGEHDDGHVAKAWSRVSVSRNLPVTIVLALENGLFVFSGDPVDVTSNDRESAAIRSVVEQAVRLKTQPERLPDLVSSLSNDPNPALAGYLTVRLATYVEPAGSLPPALLLLKMLPNPSVPGDALDFIATIVGSDCVGLPAADRATVLQRFLELAKQQDVDNARAAYTGLAKIASIDHSITDSIPPETIRAIGNNYRALVETGRLKRNQLLESGLAIKVE
jgi:hypothetical protein